MANLYDTILECETNDTLLNLLDPKKIIANTWSEFSYSEHNELVFESQGETMHKDIILLSKKLREEVFTAICYDHEINEKTEIRYIRYEAGNAELLGHMPIYSWENYVQTIEASGKEEFELLELAVGVDGDRAFGIGVEGD